MEYEILAKELLKYMALNERLGHMIQNSITEISKGELAVLLYLIDENDGACALDISKHFYINTSRVAAILKNLTKKQFIERKIDINDKRKIHVYITDLGRQYALKHRDEASLKVAALLKKIGKDDALEYIRIMKKVVDVVHEMDCESI